MLVLFVNFSYLLRHIITIINASNTTIIVPNTAILSANPANFSQTFLKSIIFGDTNNLAEIDDSVILHSHWRLWTVLLFETCRIMKEIGCSMYYNNCVSVSVTGK